MSGYPYPAADQPAAWRRYLDREHAAQAAYLSAVKRHHLEYLTGPWPDRIAFEHAERSEWITYYQSGRDAWRAYTAELDPPPPPPAQRTAAAPAYTPAGPPVPSGWTWTETSMFEPRDGDRK